MDHFRRPTGGPSYSCVLTSLLNLGEPATEVAAPKPKPKSKRSPRRSSAAGGGGSFGTGPKRKIVHGVEYVEQVVRAHTKLQRYGKGLSLVRLIEIAEYVRWVRVRHSRKR